MMAPEDLALYERWAKTEEDVNKLKETHEAVQEQIKNLAPGDALDQRKQMARWLWGRIVELSNQEEKKDETPALVSEQEPEQVSDQEPEQVLEEYEVTETRYKSHRDYGRVVGFWVMYVPSFLTMCVTYTFNHRPDLSFIDVWLACALFALIPSAVCFAFILLLNKLSS